MRSFTCSMRLSVTSRSSYMADKKLESAGILAAINIMDWGNVPSPIPSLEAHGPSSPDAPLSQRWTWPRGLDNLLAL